MKKTRFLPYFVLFTLLGCEMGAITPTSSIPFQPQNPYFYNIRNTFDMFRAWIDFAQGVFPITDQPD